MKTIFARLVFMRLALMLMALVLTALIPAKAANLSLDGNLSGLCGTATASAGAATLANKCGVITSESLTTAAGAVYTLTVTDTVVAAADVCFSSVQYGTSTTGSPAVTTVDPAAGSLVVLVQNVHASAALNGTILVSFFCFKP